MKFKWRKSSAGHYVCIVRHRYGDDAPLFDAKLRIDRVYTTGYISFKLTVGNEMAFVSTTQGTGAIGRIVASASRYLRSEAYLPL